MDSCPSEVVRFHPRGFFFFSASAGRCADMTYVSQLYCHAPEAFLYFHPYGFSRPQLDANAA